MRTWSRLSVIVLASVAAGVVASCSTMPVEDQPINEPVAAVGPAVEPAPEPIPEVEPAPVPEVAPTVFDPASVSSELKQATFFDVRALIQGLNAIIQAKDYAAWSSALTAEYQAYYSSPETLAKLSDSPVLRRQGIALYSLQDYFINVVYPSRQNDRVDDIEFIDAARIRAIIINAKGERLVLYNLEKIGDTWKIAIWR